MASTSSTVSCIKQFYFLTLQVISTHRSQPHLLLRSPISLVNPYQAADYHRHSPQNHSTALQQHCTNNIWSIKRISQWGDAKADKPASIIKHSFVKAGLNGTRTLRRNGRTHNQDEWEIEMRVIFREKHRCEKAMWYEVKMYWRDHAMQHYQI